MRSNSFRSIYRGGSLFSALCVLLLAGCGGDPTYPVEGVVKYQGDEKPATDLAGGAVVFTSLDLKESSKGVIASDGTFVLETLNAREGALSRKYKVAVVPPVSEGNARSNRSMDPKFASPVTSPIEVEVKKGPNQFEIVVEARRAKTK